MDTCLKHYNVGKVGKAQKKCYRQCKVTHLITYSPEHNTGDLFPLLISHVWEFGP